MAAQAKLQYLRDVLTVPKNKGLILFPVSATSQDRRKQYKLKLLRT